MFSAVSRPTSSPLRGSMTGIAGQSLVFTESFEGLSQFNRGLRWTRDNGRITSIDRVFGAIFGQRGDEIVPCEHALHAAMRVQHREILLRSGEQQLDAIAQLRLRRQAAEIGEHGVTHAQISRGLLLGDVAAS
jgi:hypothetical protein